MQNPFKIVGVDTSNKNAPKPNEKSAARYSDPTVNEDYVDVGKTWSEPIPYPPAPGTSSTPFKNAK